MKSQKQIKGALYFFLDARWLPPNTPEDNWTSLTVGDLRYAGKAITRAERAKLSRAITTFFRSLGVKIPAPFHVLADTSLTLGDLAASIHDSQEG